MKKLAIVGSSGGNLRSQGGADPKTIVREVTTQADAAGIEVGFVQFVLTETTMDGITPDARAQLCTLGDDGELVIGEQKTLREVNEDAVACDERLASMIEAGEIDGMMLMSSDPKGANNKAILAAAAKGIPVAGTGGTSMADAKTLGVNIVAVSGTTGTTSRTRAVSAIAALSQEWGLKYKPFIGGGKGGSEADVGGSVWSRVNIRGIMMASMPGFIAMALCLACSKIPGAESLEDVFNTLVGYLPIIIAAIAAKQVSGMDEVGIVAGIVAGALAMDGGIIGGIIVGILAGVLVYYISSFCFAHKVPGTTTNIAAGGLGGLIAGFVGMYAVAPLALVVGNGIKYAIDAALAFSPLLAGGVAGFAIWFAIMGGVYHAAILPIVLLEMEASGYSFLGAIDATCLAAVCAGIQLAYIIRPVNSGDRPTAIANIIINLAFGTFVEAAYPFMFSKKSVFAGTIVSATLSGLVIGFFDAKFTAYVPLVIAPFMSNDKPVQVAIALIFAIAVSCIITLFTAHMPDKKGEAAEAVAE